MTRQVEILAPAGSFESLKAAVGAGADAVYAGGSRFGARAYAENFSEEELLQAIDYVHIHGCRIYLTVNTLLKDREIEQLYEYLLPFYLRGLDGVIVQDLGVLEYVRAHFPDLPIHASTQMTITSRKGAAFLKEQGVARVVPARELSLEEIRRIKEDTELEVECFVHGAMCYCYSGQCLLSSMIGGRSGNRGQCAQPCRLTYHIPEMNQNRDIMSLRDLCTIDLLPELAEAGIDSFKIEGRMKQPEYVYTVVSMYRKYLDRYLAEGKEHYFVVENDRKELLDAYQRRGYTDGYYRRHNGREMISFRRPSFHGREKDDAGLGKSFAFSEVKEKIKGNLILSPDRCAKLILECGDFRVECEGAVPEPAKSQPLSADRVEKQMRKTGNTEFVFTQFHVTIEGELFLPMQALNELRRDGLQKLSECILSKYRRSWESLPEKVHERTQIFVRDHMQDIAIGAASDGEKQEPGGNDIGFRLSALVRSEQQLDAVLAEDAIAVVYIDGPVHWQRECVKRLQAGTYHKKNFYLALPYIFRDETLQNRGREYLRTVESCDGVLLRNWEEFRWLQECHYSKELRSDYNLYVFNRWSKSFFKRLGICRYTASVELNARELRELDIRDGILIGYGCHPVMITANCIRRSVSRCTGEDGYLMIRDRYQKAFAVQTCCDDCYNVIYNSAPLFLADMAEEIRRAEPEELRLDFSTETAHETSDILRAYTDAFVYRQKVEMMGKDFTRGHLKRGVK